MWYCEVVFTSGKIEEIPFKNEEEANYFFNNLENIESNALFLKIGYQEDKVNIKNIELIKKPKKMKDPWEEQRATNNENY